MDMSSRYWYSGIQTLVSEDRTLSDEERLTLASGPLLSWYEKNRRDLPWRRNKDPYQIWISEIMLQQTRVEAVKPYYFRFMERFPNISELAAVSEEELLKYWEGLGYYSRARNLKKAAGIIEEKYGGVFPKSFEQILALPGIGSYTAGAIASIAFELPVPAVDGNVLRVLSRVTGSLEDIGRQSVKRKMEALVAGILKEGQSGDINQALIETGATVCIPKGEPICGSCPFYTVCEARRKELTGVIPVRAPKKERKIEEITVLLLECGDKIAIRKRPENGLLASMYEFYNVPGRITKEEAQCLAEAWAKREVTIEEAPPAKHIFSHTEWRMISYLVRIGELSPVKPGDGLILESWEEIREKYPIPSAFSVYKKYLDQRYGVSER